MSDVSDLESLDLNTIIPTYVHCQTTTTTATTTTTSLSPPRSSTPPVESKHQPGPMSPYQPEPDCDEYENQVAEDMGAWDSWG